MLFRTEGYVPTCYSPVCRSPCGALDLHVLGLPPAFALSQDQTLKLDLKLLNRLITTFDEVPPYLLNAIHIANNDGVTYVNVYRRSLSSSLER